MTADRRLQVGGWAALLVAVFVPLQLVVVFLGAREPDPFDTTPYRLVETARICAALVAIVGLDRLFRSISPRPARFVLAAGVIGATIGIGAELATIVGIRLAAIDTPLFLLTNLLIAGWFIGGGGILMREGGGLARVGWTSQLGGLGGILTAVAVAVPFAGAAGVTGHSLIDWYQILGLFVVVYLVRIWRYVVGGRLPGPGVL